MIKSITVHACLHPFMLCQKNQTSIYVTMDTKKKHKLTVIRLPSALPANNSVQLSTSVVARVNMDAPPVAMAMDGLDKGVLTSKPLRNWFFKLHMLSPW